MNVITKEISEKELEALLIKDMNSLEEGLILLNHQLTAGNSGIIDILATDKDGILTIIELKVKESDSQILQGLSYVDWVESNISWIEKIYEKEKEINIDHEEFPRLILIAPSFSEKLKSIAKYSMVFIDLYDYEVIKYKNIKKVLFRSIDYPEIEEIPEIPTIQGHIDYIKIENIKVILKNALDVLRENNVEIHPYRRRITLKVEGNIIGRIKCKRNSFNINSSMIDTEVGNKEIISEKDWDEAWNILIKPYLH